MRRFYLRGHQNILKRILLQAAAMNLGLLMRTLFGVGTPRPCRAALRRVFHPMVARKALRKALG
jgi:transposase